MEKLGQYTLNGHLSNENAGYSMWGFGKKDGKDYFIKQFLSPKYPYNDTMSSPERIKKRVAKCEKFVAQKRELYDALNRCSDGNDVRICELFRVESKYYITMEKIVDLGWMVPEIYALPMHERLRLCAIIAHAIAALHRGGVVHSDLKPENILFTMTPGGKVTAKIIDFDSGFLESAPPTDGEKVVGDFHYFSPEACANLNDQPSLLSCKMDVFALGVLFHQYLSGVGPTFDQEGFLYAGEAVLHGCNVILSPELPEDIRNVLQPMFAQDPTMRPTAQSVYESLKLLAGMKTEEANLAREDTLFQEFGKDDDPAKNGDSLYPDITAFFSPGDLF